MDPPKIVYQSWKTHDVPPHWASLYQNWGKFCQEFGYEHVLYSDEDNRNLIKTHYSWFLPTYDEFPYPIQRADSARYFFGHHFGCIYSDLDIGPKLDKFAELQALLVTHSAAASSSFPVTANKFLKDTLTNSFFIAHKGSAFMEKLFQSLLNPSRFHWSWTKSVLREHMHKFHILFTTGPGIVSDQALLNKHLVSIIPLEFIGDPLSPQCLVDHEAGGSWHAPEQMQKDVLKFVVVGMSLVLFVGLFLWLIVQKAKKTK
jgi:hypothetical protein